MLEVERLGSESLSKISLNENDYQLGLSFLGKKIVIFLELILCHHFSNFPYLLWISFLKTLARKIFKL
jgi:hypothetical protein